MISHLTQSISDWIPILGMALLHFLWQGLLIGALAAIGFFILRNAKAQSRYLLGCLALMLCIAMPVSYVLQASGASSIPTLVNAGSSTMGDDEAPSLNVQISATPTSISSQFFSQLDSSARNHVSLIVSIWAIGVALMAVRMALGLMWVQARVNHSAQRSDPLWQERLNNLAQRIGITRQIRLGVSNEIESPVTAGWWRPVVIVPAALITGMAPNLLEALLAHEFAHVKRMDYLVNLLQSAIEIVLFYHPVVWWLSKQIRIEREQIADDLAAGLLGEPRRLALALSELEQFQFTNPHIAQAAHGGNLMSRIKRLIRSESSTKPLSWKMLVPLAGLSAACAVLYAQVGVVNAQPTPIPKLENMSASAPALLALSSSAPANEISAQEVKASKTDKEEKLTKIEHRNGSNSDPYALIKANTGNGLDVTTNSGYSAKEIKLLGLRSKEDTLWFRENGKSYAIRDKATIAQVKEAYKPMEDLGKQMEAQGKKMEDQGKVMEEIGKQMEQVEKVAYKADSAVEKRFEEKMRQHEKKMAEFEKKMEKAAAKLEKANSNTERADAHKIIADAQAMMQDVNSIIAKEASEYAFEQSKRAASLSPLEELGKKMNAASEPMNELGKQMNQLGEKMNALATQAEKQVKSIIRAAKEKGLAVQEDKS
jgi:beta-lactamase regulating signal transducer with metallopeptidase domain